MIIMNKVIHRRYVSALKYIFIATSLITALIIVIWINNYNNKI